MAMNPMQRRARNAGLIGFLVGLILMGVVVIFLLYKMQGIKSEFGTASETQKKVYVAKQDIQSGTEVTLDSFSIDTLQTGISKGEIISDMDFEFVDEKTGEIIEKYDSDGNPKQKKMVVKTNVPAGTIMTKDMLDEMDEQTTKDQRMQEYNMIILPTLLKNGDYIDIRLQLPEGEDYIVVSKKKVVYTNADTVWLKMTEDEILTLGNAIVEAYTLPGSKLYATMYTEAGRQKAADVTYPPSEAVLKLIYANPNIRDEAKQSLKDRYDTQEQVEQRINHINSALSDYYSSMKESVESGLQEELSKREAKREEFVSSLEGTDSIGVQTE